jgi:sarcosine oxidase gamma subunit
MQMGLGYSLSVISEQTGDIQKRVQVLLREAEELKEQGQLLPARSHYAFAYLLDEALLQVGQSNGQSRQETLSALGEIQEALQERWTSEIPGLEKKLSLIIRDHSIEEALDAVAKAAGIKVKLIPGSIEDASAILLTKDVRVNYLDVRNASIMQALDWILSPVRMSWWVENGTVVAGTSRRADEESPWAYDVSILALPSAKDLSEIKDHRERVEAAKEEADRFLGAVKKELSLGEGAVYWFSPGQLLIFADAGTHARAARLFETLAEARAKVPSGLEELHAVTSARAEERSEAWQKMLAAREMSGVYHVVRDKGLQLLAAAADGRLDLEALTELQIAWRHPDAAKMLKDSPSPAVMRSIWAVSESSRTLPEEKELRALAQLVQKLAREAADDVIGKLEESPGDAAAFFATLYAALSLGDDEALMAKVRPLIVDEKGTTPDLSWQRELARALIEPADRIDREALRSVISDRIRGDDMVLLTALACRRAGGEVWETFRAESRHILGRQALDANVVLLVHRLSHSELPLLAAAM